MLNVSSSHRLVIIIRHSTRQKALSLRVPADRAKKNPAIAGSIFWFKQHLVEIAKKNERLDFLLPDCLHNLFPVMHDPVFIQVNHFMSGTKAINGFDTEQHGIQFFHFLLNGLFAH
jgi:hypothetical protein